MNGGEQAVLYGLIAVADDGLERRDHVPDDIFGGVMQQHCKAAAAIESRNFGTRESLHQQRMLRDRKNMRSLGLAIPPCDPRQAVRDVVDFDVERRGVKQVEPPSRQHALPCPRRRLRISPGSRRPAHRLRANLATAACRWQVTMWSLTIPTACM